jgi:hypothetical protein
LLLGQRNGALGVLVAEELLGGRTNLRKHVRMAESPAEARNDRFRPK